MVRRPLLLFLLICAAFAGRSRVEADGGDWSSQEFELFPASGQEQEGESRPTGPRTGDVLEPFLVPKIDLYLPEGELDFRLSRLSRNALFEGRLNYDFPSGDISAYLRYRFYRYRRTYQLTVFDTIEGQSVDRGSDYQRIRGSAGLIEWPLSFHHRTFFLGELDSIDSNKDDFEFTSGRTNTFVRFGYQLGTPDDQRSNAIVGENRGRIEQLFSAHRRIGPGDFGVTAAISYASDLVGGDFDYVKFEFAGLKRFRLTERSFAIGRIDGGTFPHRTEGQVDPERPTALVEFGGYDIPTFEFFSLKGRENLKGLKDLIRGTSKLQVTAEYFLRGFEEASYKVFGLDWTSWYWVLYGGTGAIGYDLSVLGRGDSYLTDIGVGFEASFRLRGHNFFLSAIAATILELDDDPRFTIEIKTYR